MRDAMLHYDRPTDLSVTLNCSEEELVVDGRAAMTPSQHVEQKLLGLLGSGGLQVSHIQRWMKRRPN